MSLFRSIRSLSHPAIAGLALALLSVSAVALSGCGTGGGTGPSPYNFSATTRAQLEAAVTRARTTVNIPGVIVSLYIPGEGLWETAVGVEDKQTQKPMVAGMHTRIGSVTKTFTGTAILMLADQKKLKLDDAVSKYLDFVPNGDNITIRQLANMTSGLYSYTFVDEWEQALLRDYNKPWTARELLDYGFNHDPKFSFTPPGSNIQYCNSNTVILGMVVEKVSGLKIEDFIQQRILNPLSLRNTSWPTSGAMPSPFAHGYTRQTLDGNEADATFFNPSWGNAAGQMVSDRDDMKVWAVALGEGTLLSPEMQQERLKWAPFGKPTFRYGFGIGYYNGWIGHTGSLPGYNTGVYYLPSKKAVLIIQTNTDVRRVVTPGDPPVTEEPVNSIFREITKIVTPENVPDGYDFTDDEIPE